MRDHPDVGQRQAEELRDGELHGPHALRRVVDRQDVAVPRGDARHFSKTYFLGPGGEETEKIYALRDAMAGSGKAAIGSFVMRGTEYLAAVRADGDALVLETLFFADEVRDPHQQISNLPGRVDVSPQELRMARQLIDTMSGPWEPSDYRDTYTDRINDLARLTGGREGPAWPRVPGMAGSQACPARVVLGDRAADVRTIVCDVRSATGPITGQNLELPGV